MAICCSILMRMPCLILLRPGRKHWQMCCRKSWGVPCMCATWMPVPAMPVILKWVPLAILIMICIGMEWLLWLPRVMQIC